MKSLLSLFYHCNSNIMFFFLNIKVHSEKRKKCLPFNECILFLLSFCVLALNRKSFRRGSTNTKSETTFCDVTAARQNNCLKIPSVKLLERCFLAARKITRPRQLFYHEEQLFRRKLLATFEQAAFLARLDSVSRVSYYVLSRPGR